MTAIPYEQDGEWVTLPIEITDEAWLRFQASDIRKERGRVHALLRVLDPKERVLMRSVVNVDEGKEVIWFAGKAHERLNGLGAAYLKNTFVEDMESFVGGLWDFRLAVSAPEEVEGFAVPSPPAFILDPYVIEEAGTILYAPPGRGKSYTGLAMAISIDAGLSTLFPVRQARVLFVNLERSKQSFQNRIGLVNRVLGLEPTRTLLTLNARGKNLTDVMPLVERAIKEYGVEVVFLDSISRAGMGSMVEDQTANKIVDALNSIRIAWVALGHTPRADEGHVFGSVFFDAAADLCLQLLTQEPMANSKKMGVSLQITKQNDVGPRPRRTFALDFDENGLTVFRDALPGEFQQIEKTEGTLLRDRVRNFLLLTGKSTSTEIARALYGEQGLSKAQMDSRVRDISAILKAGCEAEPPVYQWLGSSGPSQFYGMATKGDDERL